MEELKIGDGDSVLADDGTCSDACYHWERFHFCGSGRICCHEPFAVAGGEIGDGDCEERHCEFTWNDDALSGKRCWFLEFEYTVLLMIVVLKEGWWRVLNLHIYFCSSLSVAYRSRTH